MTDVRSKNPFDILDDDSVAQETTTKLTRNEKKQLKNESVDNSRARPQEARLRNEYPKRGGYSGKSSRPVKSEGQSNNRRGGRGAYRGRGREFDRHSGSARRDSQKKDVAGKGTWGNATENLEEVAEEEPKTPDEESKEVKEQEPEEKQMTLSDYLASQAKKAVVSEKQIRQANEGEDESKWNDSVEISKEEESYYVAKTNNKSHKVKKQKEKNVVYDIEQHFNGDYRRGRGGRNNFNNKQNNRRNQNEKTINIGDTNDFPSLK